MHLQFVKPQTCHYTNLWNLVSFKISELQVYRVVQKNGATLHFPKYLENYWR